MPASTCWGETSRAARSRCREPSCADSVTRADPAVSVACRAGPGEQRIARSRSSRSRPSSTTRPDGRRRRGCSICTRQRRLAAAGFADDAERLAAHRSSRLTPSTARRTCGDLANSPSAEMWKCTLRSSTDHDTVRLASGRRRVDAAGTASSSRGTAASNDFRVVVTRRIENLVGGARFDRAGHPASPARDRSCRRRCRDRA